MKRFFAGVAAAAVGLGIVYAISTLFPVVPYPPVALAGLLRDIAPGGVATALIEGLKHTAKNLLSLFVHIGILASAGGAGLWVSAAMETTRRARRATVVGAATALLQIGLVAISPEHFGTLAVITYLGAAYFVGRVMSGSSLTVGFRRQVRDGETPLDVIQRSRRRFIIRALAAVVGGGAGGAAMLRVGGRKTPIDLKLAEPADPFLLPARDPSFPNVPGLSSEITSVDDFYNVDINIIKPAVDHTTWRLKIHGLVDSPYSLNYSTLQSSFEVVELAHTLSCISNEVGGDLISTAIWRGVRLGDVLRRAGLKDGVVDVVFRAADGYSDSISLTKALEPSTLLVFGMNAVPLPREHGFPARIIVPGIYGMKNVKWLTEIEPVDIDYKGYWMVRGWSDIARVKTESRIDVPTDTQEMKLPAFVAGVAWSGDRRISKVEISENGGRTWRPAILERELSPVAWRLWAAGIESSQGQSRVMVRATDGTGEVQTAKTSRPHPDGASGYDSAIFVVE